MLLAGDIGGTKTVLAVFSAENPYTPVIKEKFSSGAYPNLEAIVQQFLNHHNVTIEAAAFGVAGPVVNGVSKITNLTWTIDRAILQKTTGIEKITILNDLVATANAIPVLGPEDLHTLSGGAAVADGTIAVIAPGTGLGEAFLTADNGHYTAHPSEGGHASFSPSNAFETGLLSYLLPKFRGHVSTERVCSGTGIPNIYDYLRDIGFADEPQWFAEQLAKAGDRTPLIANNALSDDPLPLCTETLERFASILGAETGDLALTFYATGGVYLGGGIPPRILPVLESKYFHRPFCNKGRFTELMKNIPIHVILNSRAALLGAARAGWELLKR
ncbi:MAG: glucokinase [Candidatus Promineifilaceae bacterium]